MRPRAILTALLAVTSLAGAETWTDRGEYDIVMSVRSEASARKRVELLDAWKQKYPKTEMAQVRLELYLASYRELGDTVRMLQSAREMLSAQPDNAVGLYWCTALVPEVKDAPPDALEAGEKSARALLSHLDDAVFQKRKQPTELLAHRTLGWIAWQRGDLAGAEGEFRQYLEKSPKSAEIAVWMGIVSGLEKEPEKQSAGLWLLERAAGQRGEGALPDDQRRQIAALSDGLYAAYHGSSDGLEEFKAAAATNTVPPPGYRIETAAAAAARHADEELARTNPQLLAWLRIRRQLESPDADKYFTETLKTTPLPRLKGTVVRVSPENRPAEIALSLDQPNAEDVVLKVPVAFRNTAAPGTVLEFEGNADSFEKQPFRLIVQTDHDHIYGWPEATSRR